MSKYLRECQNFALNDIDTKKSGHLPAQAISVAAAFAILRYSLCEMYFSRYFPGVTPLYFLNTCP